MNLAEKYGFDLFDVRFRWADDEKVHIGDAPDPTTWCGLTMENLVGVADVPKTKRGVCKKCLEVADAL